ncbi:hypothetical protein LPB86_16255 [Pedobacter sp. MC2016-14]|uniref:hypothetical protein n=1 Tax=Pedobacter sp. MC2016-14 TaxID=2897327 RepID=UPI001E65144A|nr:hypothetical protein [Pedobacter sp. MC2016-14]MCD0489797.1 hypothetical protein [Pedobacter sp. MC2016-14]
MHLNREEAILTVPVVEGGSDIFKQVFVWEGTCLQYIKAVEDMLAAYKADPKRVALQ